MSSVPAGHSLPLFWARVLIKDPHSPRYNLYTFWLIHAKRLFKCLWKGGRQAGQFYTIIYFTNLSVDFKSIWIWPIFHFTIVDRVCSANMVNIYTNSTDKVIHLRFYCIHWNIFDYLKYTDTLLYFSISIAIQNWWK